mgnify:FL=1|nr:MAG TPA: CetZ-like protein [Caudoviricetes sp.]
MLKVGIIGIGNAGNQVAALALEKKQIPALAINASEKDLDTLSVKMNQIVFGDSAGSGKDRSIAKGFVKNNIKDLFREADFKSFMEEVDIVFVVNSTGGGTGSGMGPILTDILRGYYAKDENKVFINIGILPTLGESVGAQRNTIEYLKEMSELGGSFMLFDNETRSNLATNKQMDIINMEIVNMISIIRGDMSHSSPYGMIDDKDMRKIVSMPGMIFMDVLTSIFEDTVTEDIDQLMLKHIAQESCMTKVDNDKIVKRLGFIAYLTSELHERFNENLPAIREQFGEPIEDFKHFAENTESDKLNSVALIMSGLSIPDNRIRSMINRIEKVEEELRKTKKSNTLSNALNKISEYEGTKDSNKAEAEDFDMDSILNKY